MTQTGGEFVGLLAHGITSKELLRRCYQSLWGRNCWHLVNLGSAFAVQTTRELLIKIEASSTTQQSPQVESRSYRLVESRCWSCSCTVYINVQQLGMVLVGSLGQFCEKMLWKNGCESMISLIAKYKRYMFHESCKHEAQS